MCEGPGEPQRGRSDGHPDGDSGTGPRDGRMAAGKPDLHGGKAGHGQDATGTEVCPARGGTGLPGAVFHTGNDERRGGRKGAADAPASAL